MNSMTNFDQDFAYWSFLGLPANSKIEDKSLYITTEDFNELDDEF